MSILDPKYIHLKVYNHPIFSNPFIYMQMRIIVQSLMTLPITTCLKTHIIFKEFKGEF